MHCYDTNSGGRMNEEQFDREYDLENYRIKEEQEDD
jgi:hypothetical protein